MLFFNDLDFKTTIIYTKRALKTATTTTTTSYKRLLGIHIICSYILGHDDDDDIISTLYDNDYSTIINAITTICHDSSSSTTSIVSDIISQVCHQLNAIFTTTTRTCDSTSSSTSSSGSGKWLAIFDHLYRHCDANDIFLVDKVTLSLLLPSLFLLPLMMILVYPYCYFVTTSRINGIGCLLC